MTVMRSLLACGLLLIAGLSAAPLASTESCRALQAPDLSLTATWHRSEDPVERREVDAWCTAAGPVIVKTFAPPAASVDALAVVSWNTHAGIGDVAELVTRLRTGALLGRPATDIVLMLQEVIRRGHDVPEIVLTDAAVAGEIRWRRQTNVPDIVDLARALNLNVAYVPSMRNGTGREDRGNAVLTNLPIQAVDLIELPLGKQRRVALAVSLRAATTDVPSLRVVSVHLDTSLSLSRGGPSRSRLRQVHALIEALGPRRIPTVIGADLNTWWGPDEPAARELRRAFPDAVDRVSSAPTWRGPMRIQNRLDYLFAGGWNTRMEVNRIPDRLGSDHFPLIGWLTLD
jgi:endonuclease/exonuclease/phosphatase family metal-dependent hydrolase